MAGASASYGTLRTVPTRTPRATAARSGRAAAARTTRRRADGEVTRARMLDAVIESIVEKGYYQTSSNEIARRAGVTWGTIQHQFGTREQLLLAVIDRRWHDLEDAVATARVEGSTLEERLLSVLEVLAQHYGRPSHLAHLQIALDLTHDPNVSAEVRTSVRRHGTELERAWRPLFEQALGEAASDQDLVTYAFLTLRGYLSANVLATSISGKKTGVGQRDLLVNGVACAIRERAAEQGLSTD
jgi:AcrR family transcriptional regulator